MLADGRAEMSDDPVMFSLEEDLGCLTSVFDPGTHSILQKATGKMRNMNITATSAALDKVTLTYLLLNI